VSCVSNSDCSLFDYPGKYAVPGDGDRLARIRMEEREASNATIGGTAVGAGLACGTKVGIEDFYRRDANKAYLVLGVRHTATNGSFRAETAGSSYVFEQTFIGMPAAVPYRPPRVTPKAVVRGSQTAVVVGPSGEEIYVDMYGRVKVQFFWDREGKKDDKSSCYIRVSSTWAGSGWGFIQIPRIGQEVIVDFLEGDPDRPIIVGSVYNALEVQPAALPANKTQSGVKSHSTPGGGGYNEFFFEDKKGSELVRFHAQKDSTITVENDETHAVLHDRTKTVDHDETTHVKHDRTETVDNNETITIHGTRTETVDKDETITIHGARTEKVDKDESITIVGERSTTIGKADSLTIGDASTQSIAKAQSISIGEGLTLSVGKDRSESIGGNDSLSVSKALAVKAGTTLAIEANTSIELKVGQNSIKLEQAGITIKGMKVSIEGSIATEVKGVMTTVKGDGMLTLKGGVTMIN
jgi:type VI secretion system secreted protein VgrG